MGIGSNFGRINGLGVSLCNLFFLDFLDCLALKIVQLQVCVTFLLQILG